MRVYVLEFASTAALSRAYDRLMESERVGSCMLEANERRLRFVAPKRPADGLVEKIYQDGNLIWCTRHDFTQSDEIAS